MLACAWLAVACASEQPTPVANPEPGDEAEQSTPALVIDHHVHLLGPELVRDWKALGVRFSRPDEVYLSPAALLESSEIEGRTVAPVLDRVVLVPMGHLYANSEFRAGLGLDLDQEYERLRGENDHVAAQARRWPGRAVALCSVNPLRPYAQTELARCREKEGVVGIKVHVASNEIDLREPEHMATLARLAGWLEEAELSLLIHLDPQRRGHTTAHVEAFANEVLGPHPRLQVIVAHLGGSGGYGPWTQSVFRALLSWVELREAEGDPRSGLYFDLSAAYLPRASEGVPATTQEQARALADDLRRAGPKRLLFGSDYPVFAPQDHALALREQVGLSAEELTAIQANFPPRLFKGTD